MICIWCKQDFTKLSKEHAIPHALGCPEDLILANVACMKCNTELGRKVDAALVKQFEVLTVFYGVRRKNGRQPTIASWSALASEHTVDGHSIYLNGGPGTIEKVGKKLHPAHKSNGITNTWVKKEGGRLGIGFDQAFGDDPAFLPALFKIGLNLVAKFFGPEVAASSDYDHIRAFVRMEKDALTLTVAMDFTDGMKKGTGAPRPFTKVGRAYPMFKVEILGVFFLIDVSPEQSMLRDLRGAATLMDQPFYVFPTIARN